MTDDREFVKVAPTRPLVEFVGARAAEVLASDDFLALAHGAPERAARLLREMFVSFYDVFDEHGVLRQRPSDAAIDAKVSDLLATLLRGEGEAFTQDADSN